MNGTTTVFDVNILLAPPMGGEPAGRGSPQGENDREESVCTHASRCLLMSTAIVLGIQSPG